MGWGWDVLKRENTGDNTPHLGRGVRGGGGVGVGGGVSGWVEGLGLESRVLGFANRAH